MKKKWITVLLLILMLSGFSGCFTRLVALDADHEGRIVDTDTGEPIEGVVVLAVWLKERQTIAGTIAEYYDAREDVADAAGYFNIPGQGPRVMTNLQPATIHIFKAGYQYARVRWDNLNRNAEYRKFKISFEGGLPIFHIKKLTMEERKKQGTPHVPHEAELENIINMLREIDKDRIERGLDARKSWGDKEYE